MEGTVWADGGRVQETIWTAPLSTCRPRGPDSPTTINVCNILDGMLPKASEITPKAAQNGTFLTKTLSSRVSQPGQPPDDDIMTEEISFSS